MVKQNKQEKEMLSFHWDFAEYSRTKQGLRYVILMTAKPLLSK